MFGAELSHLTLILASDGIWDLWEYEDVFKSVAYPPEGGEQQSLDAAQTFFARSVSRGEQMFDEKADNMTAVVVYFRPDGTLAGRVNHGQQAPHSMRAAESEASSPGGAAKSRRPRRDHSPPSSRPEGGEASGRLLARQWI